MPLSPAGLTSLTRLRNESPARLDKLLEGVRSGEVSAADAAAQLPGVSAADIAEAAVSGLEPMAGNRDAQALGRAGEGASATFGGLQAGGTLASKGMLFNQTVAVVGSAHAALSDASTRELSLSERVRDLLPEFRGGLGLTALKGLAIGAAAGGGAFFVNPLLAPVMGIVGAYMGMKSFAIEGTAGQRGRDPITADEGAAIKATFDAASDVEKGAMAAAVARFDRTSLEIAPEAAAVLDDIAAHVSSPAGQQADRLLGVAVAAQAVVDALAPKKRWRFGNNRNKKVPPPDVKPLSEALQKLTPAELDEVRPFLWDALHDKKGNPTVDLETAPPLATLLFGEQAATELAAYMVAGFCTQGSTGGESLTAKEVNLLLARLERFPPSVSHPALAAVGERMTTLKIEPDAAKIMANVLQALSPPS